MKNLALGVHAEGLSDILADNFTTILVSYAFSTGSGGERQDFHNLELRAEDSELLPQIIKMIADCNLQAGRYQENPNRKVG